MWSTSRSICSTSPSTKAADEEYEDWAGNIGVPNCDTGARALPLSSHHVAQSLDSRFTEKLELNSLRNRASVVSAADAENGTPARRWMAARGLRGEVAVGGKGRCTCCAHIVGL